MALLVLMTLPGPAVPPTVPAGGPTPPRPAAVDPGGGTAAVRPRPCAGPLGA